MGVKWTRYAEGAEKWREDEMVNPLCHKNPFIPEFEQPRGIPGGQSPCTYRPKEVACEKGHVYDGNRWLDCPLCPSATRVGTL